MALATYADLQASVASWMNRTDLGPVIPDFIAIAESRIADDLRLREMLATVNLTSVGGLAPLPADWLEFERLSFNGAPLEGVTTQRLRGLWPGHLPTVYAIEGATLLVPGDVTLAALYYARVPALAAAGSNWLLARHPNIYLYGALVSACQFTMADERANYWGALYTQAVQAAKSSEVRAMSSGGPLRMRGPLQARGPVAPLLPPPPPPAPPAPSPSPPPPAPAPAPAPPPPAPSPSPTPDEIAAAALVQEEWDASAALDSYAAQINAITQQLQGS